MSGGDELVQRFLDLFEGRSDGYGTVEGNCVKEPLTFDVMKRHLYEDGRSIGVYPLVESPTVARLWEERLGGPVGSHFVKWGCSDIDNKADPEACLPLALNLQGALLALGIDSFVERTKGKGYHVWVFAEEWVPAIVMRRAFLVAHQVAGVAATEVNPKQVTFGAKGWGNYVNLPYPSGSWDAEKPMRRVVIRRDDPSWPLPVGAFAARALDLRASFAALRSAASLYVEPPKPSVGRLDGPPSAKAEELAKKLPGLAWKIFHEGVLEGRDRSGTLQRLAYLCAEADVPAADTLEIVTDADRRWGKFADRADGPAQLEKIVIGAYR